MFSLLLAGALIELVVPATAGAASTSDAGKLVFVRSSQIYTSTATGTVVKKLTSSAKNYRPRWSPDGTRIAYVHEAANGARDLWVMKADGTGKAQVTHVGDATQAAWSPDGLWLAFGSSGRVTLPASVGGPLKKIRSTAPFGSPVTLPMIGLPAELDDDPATVEELDPTVGVSIDWSPDGRKIVFDSLYSTFPAMRDEGWNIVVYNLGTTKVRPVAGGCSGDAVVGCDGPVHDPSWSHDGSYVVHTEQIDFFDDPTDHPASPNLAYAAVTAAPPVAFPDVAGDLDAEFSPSGTQIIFTHGQYVVTAKADGSGRKRVTTGYNADWQPLP